MWSACVSFVVVFVCLATVGCMKQDKCGVVATDEQRVTGTLTFPANMYQPERKEDVDTTFERTSSPYGGPQTFHFVIDHPPAIPLDLTLASLPAGSYADDNATRNATLCTSRNVCDSVVGGAKIDSTTSSVCNGPDSVYVTPCAQSFDFEVAVDGELAKGNLHVTQRQHVDSKSCDE